MRQCGAPAAALRAVRWAQVGGSGLHLLQQLDLPVLRRGRPIRSMAKAYLELFIVRSDRYKEKYIKEMIEKFRIDGIIYHDAKTCPYTRTAGTACPDGWRPTPASPRWSSPATSTTFRCVSDEQTKTNVEAFIEQIAEGR